MPEHFARLNAVQIFQLVAIVLILPIQYFISQKSSEAHRQYQLDRFLTHIQSSLSNVFNNSFVRWCYEKLAINDADGKTQEDIIPKTSMKSKEKSKEENFGLSLTPRTYRAPVILYKVGQVVRHKKRGFLGVIVGWDEKAKAPVDWLRKVRPENKAVGSIVYLSQLSVWDAEFSQKVCLKGPFILPFSDGTEWNRSSTASNVQSGNLLSVGKYNVILWKTTDDNLQPNYVPSIVFRSVSSEKEWNNSPNYAVLVDIRSVNSNAPQVGYVVQENLELVTNTRILHPLLDSYFENYVNGRYVMRPWLENVYPLDDR